MANYLVPGLGFFEDPEQGDNWLAGNIFIEEIPAVIGVASTGGGMHPRILRMQWARSGYRAKVEHDAY